MRFQKSLQGKAKGSVSVDALLEHLHHLSGETVNINAPGLSVSGVIVEKWQFDGESFDVQFSEQAIDFLQAADDPRIEIVAVLFNEIG